jgi:hypothetical protein
MLQAWICPPCHSRIVATALSIAGDPSVAPTALDDIIVDGRSSPANTGALLVFIHCR